MFGFELAVMAAMIAVNSVFAGFEIALASASLTRLQRLSDQGRSGASSALWMKQNMEASLAVVQLGITLVGAVAAAVGGAGAEESVAPLLEDAFGVSERLSELLALGFVVIPLTVVTIIFGELIPKVFALRHAERVCLTLSPGMRLFSRSVWPAVWLFETIVTGIMSWGERRMRENGNVKPETAELQDLRASAALARASRLIGHREESIIVGATEMPARPVRDIMLPAEHMSALDADATLSESLIAAHLDMHTRFPVFERKGDPQSVLGYVNVKDIIATMRLNPRNASLRSIIRPLPSFNGDQPIIECLEGLMRGHTHIALIRDEVGRVIGMITLEDILEELVGEIEDEYDRLPGHLIPVGSSWVVGGGVLLERLKNFTGIDLTTDLPEPDARTLNDWVTGHLGREVRGGDIVARNGIRVVVRTIRRQKVQEAQIVHEERPAV